MALHDYRCPACHTIVADVNVPIAIGATRWSVSCPACEQDLGQTIACEWIPQVGRMDVGNGPGFAAFDAYDGHNNPVRIDSVHKARAVERESEQLARNKEGQQIAFRALNQHTSNQVDNTFGDARAQRKDFKTRNTKGVPFVSKVGDAPAEAL